MGSRHLGTVALRWAAVLALLQLAGCMSADRRIDTAVLARVHSLAIVPMQAPPLLLAPEPYGSTALQLGLATHAAPLCLIAGLVAVIDLPAAVDCAETAAEAFPRASATGPTAQIAHRFAAPLAARHPAWTIRSARDAIPVPDLVDPARTWHMRNWLGPVRTWYDDDGPDAAAPSDELALTVAVGNFEIYRNTLIVHVLAKATTPGGHVVGRASAALTRELPPPAELFAGDAEPLAAAIAALADEAAAILLPALGLLPP